MKKGRRKQKSESEKMLERIMAQMDFETKVKIAQEARKKNEDKNLDK